WMGVPSVTPGRKNSRQWAWLGFCRSRSAFRVVAGFECFRSLTTAYRLRRFRLGGRLVECAVPQSRSKRYEPSLESGDDRSTVAQITSMECESGNAVPYGVHHTACAVCLLYAYAVCCTMMERVTKPCRCHRPTAYADRYIAENGQPELRESYLHWCRPMTVQLT
ncbi:hypothetical protein T310_5144, partial [Rasamsonia emersonii CBS 393.64]